MYEKSVPPVLNGLISEIFEVKTDLAPFSNRNFSGIY